MSRNSHSSNVISIGCAADAGPGTAWSIEVEFRPLSRGFSVWVNEYNLLVDHPKWHKVNHVPRPLNWRTACTSLTQDEELRVFGDFWQVVHIEGVPPWAEDIARCLFIQDDDAAFDYRSIAELLLGFADPEVQSILNQIKPIPAEPDSEDVSPALSAIQSISETVNNLGLVGETFEQIKVSLGLQLNANLQEVATKVGQIQNQQRQIQNQQCILRLLSAPLGKQAEQYWKELSMGPLPGGLADRVSLIQRWLSEPEKPTGDGLTGGIMDSGEWPILMWLLGGKEQMFSILEALKHQQPKQAAMLVEEVMKRGKSDADYFVSLERPSARLAEVVGHAFKRSHVNIALEVQRIAGLLTIPLAEKYRNGELR